MASPVQKPAPGTPEAARPVRPGITAVVIAVVLGAIAFSIVARIQADFDPAKAGMGMNTTGHTAYLDGRPVSSGDGLESMLETFRWLERRDGVIALWLGASQLHAINDYHPGDELAVHYLNESAQQRDSNLTFLLASMANGSLQDLLMIYLHCRSLGLTPDWLMVAVVYDDLREDNNRRGLMRRVGAIPHDVIAMGGEGVDMIARKVAAADEPDAKAAPVERNATAGTPQEALESALVTGLQATLPGYEYANRVSARISIRTRMLLADIMSGMLKQRRAPPIPAAQAQVNHEALLSLVRLARADSVRVLLYRQPHRPGERPFYHKRRDYDAYYGRIAALADSLDGVYAIDLETIVPARYYGRTNSGRPDAFHFTDAGHRILAEHLNEFFVQHEKDDHRALQ
jgi:hypothetical protein